MEEISVEDEPTPINDHNLQSPDCPEPDAAELIFFSSAQRQRDARLA
jgi:hypothetical protein